MTRLRERLGGRTAVLTGAGILVFLTGVLAALVAVPAIQEHRSAAHTDSVVADANALRSAILKVYPRGTATMTLAQRGGTASIVKRDSVVGTVDLSDGENKVSNWTPPTFSRSGWPFAFCIEHDDREWALYVSSDGVVRETGADGECAVPDLPGVNVRYPCPTPTWKASDRPGGKTRVNIPWGRPNSSVDLTRWVPRAPGRSRRCRRGRSARPSRRSRAPRATAET